MEFPVTAQQVRQTVIDHGITHLPHHDCSICGAWVMYVFSETNGQKRAKVDRFMTYARNTGALS